MGLLKPVAWVVLKAGFIGECRDGLHSQECSFPASQLQAATLRGVCFGIAQDATGKIQRFKLRQALSRFLISFDAAPGQWISKTCNLLSGNAQFRKGGSAGR